MIEIRPPVGNTRGPLSTESMLRAIHRTRSKAEPLSRQIRSQQGSVGLSVDVSDDLRVLFTQELQDAYPETTVHPVRSRADQHDQILRTDLQIRPDVLPTRTYEQFLDLADGRQFSDPLTASGDAVSGWNGQRSGRLNPLYHSPQGKGRPMSRCWDACCIANNAVNSASRRMIYDGT